MCCWAISAATRRRTCSPQGQQTGVARMQRLQLRRGAFAIPLHVALTRYLDAEQSQGSACKRTWDSSCPQNEAANAAKVPPQESPRQRHADVYSMPAAKMQVMVRFHGTNARRRHQPGTPAGRSADRQRVGPCACCVRRSACEQANACVQARAQQSQGRREPPELQPCKPGSVSLRPAAEHAYSGLPALSISGRDGLTTRASALWSA